MKKRCLTILVSLIAALFLFACQQEEEKSNDAQGDRQSELDVEEMSDNDTLKEEEPENDLEVDNDTEQPKGGEEPLYTINPSTWAVEPLEEGTNPQVALITIDDAPDQYALDMAHTLKALDAPAIFFVNGHFLQTEEKHHVLKEIHELGFMIGNHTSTHPNLGEISEEEQRKEIIELNDLVEEIIGERPKFFRAPFGANTATSHAVAEEEGMVVMNWTYGYDWEPDYTNAEALADIMINTPYLSAGANLLMHDREWTNEALETIVTGLRDKGYELVDPTTLKRLD